MFYYRYRSNSQLAIKELIYDELYFASNKECNDPYDGKAFLIFGPERGKWQRLFETAWNKIKRIETSELAKKLASRMVEIGPLMYEEAIDFNYANEIVSISSKYNFISIILDTCIKNIINIYGPKENYYACFSKTRTNLLMWSHYASMHQGYCLIFKSIDGGLYQHPDWKIDAINRKTDCGISSSMSYYIPEKFQFREVDYHEQSTQTDAFMYFTPYIYGRDIEDESERLKFVAQKEKAYLEKHMGWKYEEEVRVLLPTPEAWLFGEKCSYSSYERLMHYSPTQLVGIVLGARMDETQKERMYQICKDKSNRIASDCKNSTIFDFILFEAKLQNDSRGISIEPKTIFSLGSEIKETDQNFTQKYNEWEEGWALVFEDGRCTKRKIE